MKHDQYYNSHFGNKKPYMLKEKDRKHYITYMLTKKYDQLQNETALLHMLRDMCEVRREIDLEIMRQEHILANAGTPFNKASWRIAHCEFDLGGANRVINKITEVCEDMQTAVPESNIVSRMNKIISDIDSDVQSEVDR